MKYRSLHTMSFEIKDGILINYKYQSGKHDVVVPDDVTEIGPYVFFNKIGLHSIKIPANVKIISKSAFYGCINLRSMTLSEGLEEIGSSAFENCENLFEITIPSTVYKIGDSAFYGCKNLKKVDDLSALADISSSMFSHCKNLKYVSLSEGITSIGDSAFSYCEKLTQVNLPESIKKIGDNAFSDCKALESLVIPDGLETIGKDIGGGFGKVVILYATPGSAACNVLRKARYNYRETGREFALLPIMSAEGEKTGCILANADESIRRAVIPEGVTRIASRAFDGCGMLEEVLIPDTVCYIGDKAFAFCNSLKTINIPGSIKTIDQAAFAHCESLEEVTLHDGLESIYQEVFSSCKSLKEINIPGSVKTINRAAFAYCESLEEVTLHDGLESIWDDAFSSCKSLKEIKIPDSVKDVGKKAFSNCSELEMAKLPADLEVIHDDLFWNCKKLNRILLPKRLKEIKERAFAGCEAINGIILQEGLTRIGGRAFQGCKSLTSVIIPSSLEVFGDGAFVDCSSLRNFEIMEGNEHYIVKNGMVTTKSTGRMLFCLPFQKGECVIPEQVTEIWPYAFSGCHDITKIIFPSTIRRIARSAFTDFGSHLETVEISDLSAWLSVIPFPQKEINTNWYSGQIPNSCQIPNPFVNHAQMTINGQVVYDLIIPNGIKSIRDEAFKGCGSITSVYIPDSVIYLGNRCFDDCPNLKVLSISGDITGLMPHSLEPENISNQITVIIRNQLGSELAKYISRRKRLAEATDFHNVEFGQIPVNARLSMTNRIAERLNNGEDLPENLRNDYLNYLTKNKKNWISKPEESMFPVLIWMLREKLLSVKEIHELIKMSSNIKNPLLMGALLEYQNHGFSAEEKMEYEQAELDEMVKDMMPVKKLSETAYLQSIWMVARGTSFVKKMKKTTENVVFPTKIGKKTLTGISDDFVFLDEDGKDVRTQVKSITIPAGYKKIGRNAFMNCTNLEEIIIESGLEQIDYSAFKNCTSLKKIMIPGSVKSVGDDAFSFCNALKEIIIQDGVEVISEDAFFMCEALKVIDLPASVTDIKARAFAKSGIEVVIVRGEKTLIRWPYAFEGCRNYWIYAGPGFNSDQHVPEILVRHLEEYDKVGRQKDIVSPLNGKSFAVAGELKTFNDSDALVEAIEQLGGKLKNNITKTVTALITNRPASGTNKILKAKEYGIPIINERKFLNMIKMKRIENKDVYVYGLDL